MRDASSGDTHLKEEALDRTMWRNSFGRGVGPVVRQNTEWINDTGEGYQYLIWRVKLIFLCSSILPEDAAGVPKHVAVWFSSWIAFYDFFFILPRAFLVNVLNVCKELSCDLLTLPK